MVVDALFTAGTDFDFTRRDYYVNPRPIFQRVSTIDSSYTYPPQIATADTPEDRGQDGQRSSESFIGVIP
jgi:hypothetical protein